MVPAGWWRLAVVRRIVLCRVQVPRTEPVSRRRHPAPSPRRRTVMPERNCSSVRIPWRIPVRCHPVRVQVGRFAARPLAHFGDDRPRASVVFFRAADGDRRSVRHALDGWVDDSFGCRWRRRKVPRPAERQQDQTPASAPVISASSSWTGRSVYRGTDVLRFDGIRRRLSDPRNCSASRHGSGLAESGDCF